MRRAEEWTRKEYRCVMDAYHHAEYSIGVHTSQGRDALAWPLRYERRGRGPRYARALVTIHALSGLADGVEGTPRAMDSLAISHGCQRAYLLGFEAGHSLSRSGLSRGAWARPAGRGCAIRPMTYIGKSAPSRDELVEAIRSDVDRIKSLLHNPEPLEMTT